MPIHMVSPGIQEFLPFSQRGGNVVWNTVPCFAWRARAVYIVRPGVPAPAVDGLGYNTPLWHSCLLQKMTKICRITHQPSSEQALQHWVRCSEMILILA